MISLVRPEVKFSQSIVKGSPKDRHKMVEEISDKIFTALSGKAKNDKIMIDDIYSAMEKFFPEKKNIKIISLKKSRSKHSSLDYIEKNGEYIGQEIAVPINKRKLPLKFLPIYMHELTHALDILCNPKVTGRTRIMERKKLYDKGYDTCFEKTLYNWEEYTNNKEKEQILEQRKNELKNWLSKKTLEEKVNYIQDLRNYIISEINAYSAERKYALAMTKKGQTVAQESIEPTDHYLFKEKLDLLNKIAISLIDKAKTKRTKIKTISVESK